MSSSVSNGSVPRSAASSLTVRPFRPSFAVGVGVAEDVVRPVREAAEHPGLFALRPLVHPLAGRGVLELLDPLRHREAHDLLPAREHEQRAVGAEAHVHRDDHRHAERDEPTAGLGRDASTPASWRVTRSGTRESTVSTFQLSGRCPATDMLGEAARSPRR